MWAAQSLRDADVDAETVLSEDVPSTFESYCKAVGSVRYLVAPLWASKQGRERAVAALVLGFDDAVPRMPEPQVLSAIAAHLVA
jgi:hypothetical protein